MECTGLDRPDQTEKIAKVIREMDNYNIGLLGVPPVSETRWVNSGPNQLVSGHHVVIYSGRTDEQHSREVAIITTNEIHKSLIEWKPIYERLIKARYNSGYAKLSVIVCYAQTEDAEEEDKILFMISYKRQ